MSNTSMAVAGIVVILIIVGIAYFVLYNGNSGTPYSASTTTTGNGGSSPQTQRVPVYATDPQNVPPGTQALIVSYSQVQVQTAGSGWVTAQGSGTVNLTAVTNSSQVVAYATVPANTTITAVQMTVTQATIVVNGTAHSVAVANSNIASSVSTNANARVTSSTGVLLDVSPTVTAQSSGSGSATYTMTTTAQAAVLINLSASVMVSVGGIVAINGASAGLVSVTTSGSGSQTDRVPVFVTDPPNVPKGTQTLTVSYSQVRVQTAADAAAGVSSQWITAEGSGQVDLTAVVNSSQVVGYVTVPVNATITAVQMTVTNATIVINGTAHAVAIASNNVSSTVSSSASSNAKIGASGGILLQISPTVNETFTPAGFNSQLGVYESNSTTTYSMSTMTQAAVLVNLSASVNVGVGGIVGINGAAGGLVSIT